MARSLKKAGRGAARWVVGAALLCCAGHPAAASGRAATERFVVTASRYRFEPARLEVRAGDVVELALHSADTTHGLEIDAFGVKAVIPKGGAVVTVSFVADKVGVFPFACSEYCGSGHKRMKGELVVEEATQ
jgi:cytochrome c oxidase subunit 2